MKLEAITRSKTVGPDEFPATFEFVEGGVVSDAVELVVKAIA